MGLDPVLKLDQWTELVDRGLAGRPTLSRRFVRDGVIKFQTSGVSGVGKAAGRHTKKHRFPDPARNLITIYRWSVLRVDDRLYPHLAVGVGEEPLDVAKGDRSDPFHAGSCSMRATPPNRDEHW